MAIVVGEAEIIIRANTAGLDAQLAGATDASLAGASDKATLAGEEIGAGLSGGVDTGAKDIGKATEADLEASTGRMSTVVDSFSSKAKNSLQSIGLPPALLNGPAALTLVGAGITAFSLKMASDMQSADASIAASSGQSIKAVTGIGNAFLSTAGTTEFSGIDMAKAYAQVAGQLKATEGQALTSAQALLFMKSAGDLATASGEDLSTSTATLGGVLQAFQLNVNDTADAANVLFNASNATGQSQDSLASALERTRSKLGETSPSLSALTTLVVDMTNAGVTGRSALTGLNGAMTSLMGAATGTTKTNMTAAETLKQYGLSAVQANGQLTPMSAIIAGLAPKYATMSQSQQLATSTLIFGAASAKAMTAVIDAGTKSYDNASNAVNKQNGLQDAAAKKADTLSGEWKILKSDLVDVGTQLGQVLIPAFTDFLKVLIPVIDDGLKVVDFLARTPAVMIPVATILAGLLIPKIITWGTEMLASAGKTITAFGESAAASVSNSATVVSSFLSQEVSAEAFGTTMIEVDGEIVAANATAAASFTAMLGPIAAVGAAALISFEGTTKLLDLLKNRATVKPTAVAGSTTMSQEDIVKEWAKSQGIDASTLFTGDTAVGSGVFAAADAWWKKKQEAQKKADDAKKSKSSSDAYIAPVDTTAVKSASSAAVKAANTLTSEVVKAISLPQSEAAASLIALGVPATKASQVLKDAVLPFTQAVAALEKAGFDASDAVKIAEAGQKKTTKATDNTSGVTVNGIQVSGAVYDAAVGSALNAKGGAMAIAGVNAPSTPTPPTININPGAVVINPAQGNTPSSLQQTQTLMEELLKEMTQEIQAGYTSLAASTS